MTPALELTTGRRRKLFIGVVHLGALPGAPRYAGALEPVIELARTDATALLAGGCDALIVENFGDVPFFGESVPAETIAALALALVEVRSVAGACALGVNVLRNDARAALGLCATGAASFLRVNVHTGAAVTDQGLLEGRAAETLRVRARIAPHAKLLADVHVKHAAPLGGGRIQDAARDAALRGLADALVVSGRATGAAPDAGELGAVRDAVATPLLIGSGLDEGNARELLGHADGAIVGSALKHDGRVSAPVEERRVRRLRELFDAF